MKRVPLPQLTTGGGLPTTAYRAVELQLRTGEPVLLEETLERRDAHRTAADPPGELELASDQGGRASGILPLHRQHELLKLGRERTNATSVLAHPGKQSIEPVALVAVVPLLQRLHRDPSRHPGGSRPNPAGQLAQTPLELASLERAVEKGTQHGMSEEGFLFSSIVVHRHLLGLGFDRVPRMRTDWNEGHGPPLWMSQRPLWATVTHRPRSTPVMRGAAKESRC